MVWWEVEAADETRRWEYSTVVNDGNSCPRQLRVKTEGNIPLHLDADCLHSRAIDIRSRVDRYVAFCAAVPLGGSRGNRALLLPSFF